MNKHPCSNSAIPSCEMARTLSFIYDRFDGNSLADMLEKSTSGEEGSQAERTCTMIKAPFLTLDSIFCGLIPIAVASTFCQLSLVCSLLYFYFWFSSFASSNWSTDISMVWVYSYLKELHQGRWLINWVNRVASSVVSSSHLYNLRKLSRLIA